VGTEVHERLYSVRLKTDLKKDALFRPQDVFFELMGPEGQYKGPTRIEMDEYEF